MVNSKGAVIINNEKTIQLTANQERDFVKAFKIGILKELYKKQLLTDEQLKRLIEMQK